MGGFAFDLSTGNEPLEVDKFPGRTRLTLLPDALEFLAKVRPDLIPDISADYIRDKSKANPLAKALICLQALYFCLHLVTWLSFGLGVTLLEMNTFAHAISALAVYVIWWNKPLDIDEPVLIPVTDFDAASICAAMFISSKIGSVAQLKIADDFPNVETYDPESKGFRIYNTFLTVVISKMWATLYPTPLLENSETHHEDDWKLPTLGPPPYLMTSTNLDQNYMGFSLKEMRLGIGSISTKLIGYRAWLEDVHIIITPQHLTLRILASQTDNGKELLDLRKATEYRDENHLEYDGPKMPLKDWVVDRVDNASRRMHKIQGPFWRLIVMASALYGGWHLLAWEGPFPNSTQLVLWRVAGLGVGLNAFILLPGWGPAFILFHAI